MKRQLRSSSPRRLQLVRDLDPPTLNAIEYLEVTTVDQRTLKVVCVHPVVGIELAHCRIEGGVRIGGVQIASVTTSGREIRVRVDRAGDFSFYEFALVDPAHDEDAPAGFDPCLASIPFSFKAQCPSAFDCKDDKECPPAVLAEPQLDYLAKDYSSFRRLMLDRLGQLMPGFRERNPADFNVTLVELLAHVADQLSYFQDAVATEAYLGTARRRVSLRRHARLLDYAIHEGCNSRVYITLTVNPGATGRVLPPGTAFLSRGNPGVSVVARHTLEALPEGTSVFQSLHPLELNAAHNSIAIHDFGDSNFCLPKGSREAALVADNGLTLEPGMVLIFEELTNPTRGTLTDPNRDHRQAVRLVEVTSGVDPLTQTQLKFVRWHSDDALAFPLCVKAALMQGSVQQSTAVAVARGNVVLADHGLLIQNQRLLPADVPKAGKYRPRLREFGLAFSVPYRHDETLRQAWSAARALVQDPRKATPANMLLVEADPYLAADQPLAGASPWTPQQDLLASDRFAKEFVVEAESDGSAYLRFGSEPFGAAPDPGSRLLATFRIGGGRAGNLGAESITRLVCDDISIAPFVEAVRNPMPAQGGEDAESADAVKLLAPESFRTQQRAVTEEDYARVLERHAKVQRAAARLRWTGSWYTMFVSVDLVGGKAIDASTRAELLAHVECFRLAGYDVDLNAPSYVPLEIELHVCVLAGYFASGVEQAILRRLASGEDAFGARGFFHPDNFTFGGELALSALIEATQAVTGVASIEVASFQRWGKTANKELENGRLDADALEVLRLDNDPNFPENGQLRLVMRGGL